MKRVLNATLVMIFSGFMSNLTAAAEVISENNEHFVTTDRYTQTSIKPRTDQLMPLDALVNFAFGDEVKTVGAAVLEMLEGSGYRWSAPFSTGDALLHDLALPVVNRDIGPIRLREALTTVAGPAWRLRVDDLHRVIWFESAQAQEPIKKSIWRKKVVK